MAQTTSQPIQLDQEARINLAIAALNDGSITSLREASRVYNLPRSTLQARYHGRRAQKVYSQSLQRLSVAEEESIRRCIMQMAIWGWPISIRYLEALAKDLLQRRGDTDPLGHNWYKNYLSRHPDIKPKLSRSLDQSRQDAADFSTLEKWFDLYSSTCAKYGIPEEDVYNMDEKGFMKGVGDNSKVLLPVEAEESWSIQPGDREWVSIIESIGMNGYSPPPFVIFQGKQIQHSWIPPNIDTRTKIHVSPAGWTDRAIALEWIKHFDIYTKSQVQGTYRLLILDGHTSHVSLEFIQYCEDAKIVPLCLPPHSTHILQPLDVGIFSPLAKAYKKEVSDHSLFGAERITNHDFLLFLQTARRKAITLRNIGSAWRKAGLSPFDPQSILKRFRPKTPPFFSLTNEDGVRLDIQANQDQSKRINELIAEVLQGAPQLNSPIKKLREISLTALADRSALSILNEALVKKQEKSRKARTKKNFGEARVLCVGEALQQMQERVQREQEEMKAKERYHILRGKIGFAKLVWKELQMSFDVFC